MIPTILSVALPWTMVALAGCLVFLLLRQQKLMLARLNSLDQQLGRISAFVQRRQMKQSLGQFLRDQEQPVAPPGLAAGTAAPHFELSDLAGAKKSLQDFHGRKLLLAFVNPGCGFCTQMAPELAALPSGPDAKVLPLLIASGAADAIRQMVQEYKLACPVLLDADGAVGKLYQMAGTPTGYLIDEKGVLASALAIGAPDLLALAEEDAAQPAGKANRGLAASKIIRDGLKAGAAAPLFKLPRLSGGELALEDLRGKPALLVFSDPECGPCTALAPQLETLHRQTPDLQIVMISRRDEEANRKKVAELGLTFPVVLQKQWEISKLYGIFATPIGYLVDAEGIIVHDVAKGADAILALLNSPTQVQAKAA